VGIFSRGKAGRDEATDLDSSEVAAEEAIHEESVGTTSTTGAEGPFDRSVIDDESDYLNLGPIWVKGMQGMELRLEVNEQEQQITGLTAVLGESAVQLQAFAAPRTEGVWIDIRNEISKSITDSGGTAEVVTGPFGEELQTRMPQTGPDGRTIFMPARFVGVDGPRWFLRAVVSGRAAIDPAAAGAVHELIRTTVIDRGAEAKPPRELLALRLPEQAQQAQESQEGELEQTPSVAASPHVDDLKPFERGPEITEVR
jgi:hypothetical protein